MATADDYADWIVKNAALKGTPEFDTVAQAYRLAKGEDAPKPPEKPTTLQKVQASIPGRALQGARDPIDAAAQLLPRSLELLTGLGGYAENPVSRFFGSEAKRVDAMNAGNEASYAKARELTGSAGFDGARLAGNVLSPANAAIAARLPAAATTLGRVGTGAAVGALGGALTPVDMTDQERSFAGAKTAQMGLGAVTGGVLTPILGKIGDGVAKWAAGRSARGPATAADIERIARSVSNDTGQRWENLEPAMQEQLRQQTAAAITSSGKNFDPKALMRQADFTAEGMQGTLGQVTRDASQYARERNLRTLPGVGDPLLQRFEQQGQQLQQKVGAFANGAQQRDVAAMPIIQALQSKDESLRAGVGAAYKAARETAGKDAEVPLQGLAQDFADIVDRYRTAVPSGIRGQFAKYGLDPNEVVNQRKLFTVEEADKLLKEINKQGSNEPAVQSALSELRNSVKKAVIQDAGVDDVFAGARRAAAERFKLQEAIPALEAASRGAVAPDDFVRKFILNGKSQDVQGLAKVLNETSPEAFQQARAQIGAELQKAAFGQNVAGDKAFSPERFAQALERMTDSKLSAFFSPTEIQQMHRLSRVGAYINSMPNASPVQTSNNWGAITSLAGKIPGVPVGIGLLSSVKNSIDNQSAARRALEAKILPQLSTQQEGLLGNWLSAAGMGGGLLAASEIR